MLAILSPFPLCIIPEKSTAAKEACHVATASVSLEGIACTFRSLCALEHCGVGTSMHGAFSFERGRSKPEGWRSATVCYFDEKPENMNSIYIYIYIYIIHTTVCVKLVSLMGLLSGNSPFKDVLNLS